MLEGVHVAADLGSALAGVGAAVEKLFSMFHSSYPCHFSVQTATKFIPPLDFLMCALAEVALAISVASWAVVIIIMAAALPAIPLYDWTVFASTAVLLMTGAAPTRVLIRAAATATAAVAALMIYIAAFTILAVVFIVSTGARISHGALVAMWSGG